MTTPQITPLPTPAPSRNDPNSFPSRADATMAALPAAFDEANLVATFVGEKAAEVAETLAAVQAAQIGEVVTEVEGLRDAVQGNANTVAGQVVAVAAQVVEATAKATAADGSKTAAETARSVAEAARDAATVNANVYTSTAAGLAAVANGVQFQVVATDGLSIQRYRRDSASVATAVGVAYPSADAALKPKGSGKKTGWPDPFFRTFDLTTETLFGKNRWHRRVGPLFADYTRVPNTIFDGYALRKAGGSNSTNMGGPLIHLSEIDAAPGDTVTSYMLFSVGSDDVYLNFRYMSDGSDTMISQGGGLAFDGSNKLLGGAGVAWLRVTGVVPAGAGRLALYPSQISGTSGYDVLACWSFKGGVSDGPSWPTLENMIAESATADRISALETGSPVVSGGQLRNAYVPFVTFASVLGDAESVGDLTYSQKVLGFYEQVAVATQFNVVTAPVWAANSASDIEWKAWIRADANPFNMSTTPAALSGTVAAGSFPTANGLYSLDLGSVLTLAASQHIFLAFRAVDNSNVSVARWAYDAGIVPQRHPLIFSATSGWNSSWSAGTVASGFGQASLKLLLESDELRAYKPQVTSEIAAAVAGVGTPIPEIVMPPFFYGVQGREANLYFDNLHLATAADYLHDVTSASSAGQQQAERFTWTPSGALASGALSVAVADNRTGTALVTKTAQQRAAASSAGTGTTPKLSVIGDSLVTAGIITQTMLDIAGADAMALTLIGTQGSGTNKHEGRGGWTIANYTTAGPTYYKFTVSGVAVSPAINATEYSHNGAIYRVQTANLSGGAGSLICSVTSGGAPLSSGTLTKSNGSAGDATIAFTVSATEPGNPFWKSGAVNYPQYLTDNSLSTPDWVFVSLGINDVFSYTSDTSASSTADAAFTALDTLIASIKAAGAGVKVGIVIPTPPSASQDSFGANYGAGQTRWRFKRNILIWTRQLIAKYSGQEASRIYIVPSNTALDTVNNMQTAASALVNSRSGVSVARQSNGVHPATSGYQQIGDAWWAFLKCQA